MFDKLKKLGELNKLRSQAVRLKKILASEEVVMEENGIMVRVSGDQKFKEVLINGQANRALVEILNKAVQKSQKIAAKKLQNMEGGLGMFGI